MKLRHPTAVIIGVLFALTVGGCSATSSATSPATLRLGIPPGEADPTYIDKIQPVADDIAAATGMKVKVTKTSDYLGIVEAMRSGLLDVAVFSPMPTVVAEKVAKVKPLVAALGAPYRTDIICRPAAHVTKLSDVQSHSFAFVDPGSTSGNYIPRLMLKRAGVDVAKMKETFAGGHDVAALAVKQGSTDCAAVASMVLAGMKTSGALSSQDYSVVAESDPIPISVVVIARDGLDPKITAEISRTLVKNQNPALLKLSSAKKLVPADQADWSMFRAAAKELNIGLKNAG